MEPEEEEMTPARGKQVRSRTVALRTLPALLSPVLLSGALLSGALLSGLSALLAVAAPPAEGQVAWIPEPVAASHALPATIAAANDPSDAFVPGFTPWFSRSLDRVVEGALARGAAPGAVVVIGHGGEVVLSRAWGRIDWDDDAPPADAETLYDLASVTKVAATLPAVMILVEEGRLELDEPIATYLPGWPRDGRRGRITLRHLLGHTSGLPAGASLREPAVSASAAETVEGRSGRDSRPLVRSLAGIPLEGEPGGAERYSDLGPILAALIVEEVTGEPLERFVERRVYRPLGMRRTTFRPLERGIPEDRIAPTERLEAGHLRGVVHDPSARALGGVAGNAGLFSSGSELARFASALLWETPGRIVCRDLLRAFAARDDARRRFGTGWEMPARRAVWSEVLSSEAFGHTGFTGTSLWLDPVADLFVVLLTNRVNPSSANELHHDLRREVHDLVRRAHLGREEEMRASDWRWLGGWRGPDSCRGRRSVEVLEALGPDLLAGWPALRGR